MTRSAQTLATMSALHLRNQSMNDQSIELNLYSAFYIASVTEALNSGYRNKLGG